MRTHWTMAIAMSLFLIVACGNDGPAADNTTAATPATQNAGVASEITPEQLGELGARIEKEPERATELLAERGLDEKSFEREIRKVTESPEASKRYAEAYKKSKA